MTVLCKNTDDAAVESRRSDAPSLASLGLNYIQLIHNRQFGLAKQSPSHFFFPSECQSLYSSTPVLAMHPFTDLLPLPEPQKIEASLAEALLGRKSSRLRREQPISLSELSTLLYWSCGLSPMDEKRRFYPSAGGLYPIETILYLREMDFEDSKKRLARYNPYAHTLQCFDRVNSFEKDLNLSFQQQHILDSSIILFLVSFLKRSAVKYLDRAYAFSLLESGHIAQNINVVGSALNLNICCVGGFDAKTSHQYFSGIGMDNDIICTYLITMG